METTVDGDYRHVGGVRVHVHARLYDGRVAGERGGRVLREVGEGEPEHLRQRPLALARDQPGHTRGARTREQQRAGLGWASPGFEACAARPAVEFRREQPLRFCSHTLHARLQLLSMKRLFLEHSPILAHVAHCGFLSAHSPTTSSTTWGGPHR